MTKRVDSVVPNELLQYWRKQRYLSQAEVAYQLEIIDTKQVGKWERGLVRPNDSSLRKLAELYGKTPRQLGYAVDGKIPFWSENILPQNPYFTGREDILERLHALFATREPDVAQQGEQPWALFGLPGVGKTQIAVEYAHRYKHEYHTIAWIRADTYEILASDFASFAAKLASSLGLVDQQEQDQPTLKNAVKEWLGNKLLTRWLLIFDNLADAETMQKIPDLLPTDTEYYGHILLTTRMQAYGAVAQSIEVAEMDRVVGATFLLQRAKLRVASDTRDVATHPEYNHALALAKALGGLPLALDQAGAYIEEKKITILDYLSRYNTRRDELLKTRGNFKTGYPRSVATTFSMAFDEVGLANTAAIELLYLFAFLAPDAIPEEFITEGGSLLGPVLEPLASASEALDDAIGKLLGYSLIRRNAHNKTCDIHRLMQALLQDSIDEEAQKSWLGRAIAVVNKTVSGGSIHHIYARSLRYLPHMLACLDYIEFWELFSTETAKLLHHTGSYLREQVRYEQAEPLLQRALANREQQVGHDHNDTATSLNSLALLYDRQGKYTQAEPLYVRALAICEQQVGPNYLDTATSLNNLAILYVRQGKYEQAEPLLQRALANREQQVGPDHPDTATSLNNLASLYDRQGRYEYAEPLYERALAIREQQLGPDHFRTATSLNNLAGLYGKQGKYAQAEPLLQRALAIREQQVGPNHPDTATSLNNLAMLYVNQGKYIQAEPLLQRALANREQQLGPDHFRTATSLNNLAGLYGNQGKYTQAEPLFQRALANREQQVGPDNPHTATSLNNLAGLYVKQGKYKQAEPLLQRALAIYELQLGLDHPRTATTRKNYTSLMQKMR